MFYLLEVRRAFVIIYRKAFPEADLKKLLRSWRLLSPRKILFFPHILKSSEKRLFLLGLALVLLSGVTLLGRIYVKNTVVRPDTGETHIEGMLREPRSINPLFATTDGDRDISRLIFSRLLTYNGEGDIDLDLAESYEISKDGKTYTVYMRRDALFHDGEKVDADDVVFTVKAIQNPLYKSPLRANWQGVEVAKVDDYTVRFSLRSSYAPFIENLSVDVLPKHLWAQISPDQAPLHEQNLKPIGSGPYYFSRIKQAKDGSITSFELKRNSSYYRGGPYLERINFVFFDSEDDMLVAWQKGNIDGFGSFPVFKTKDIRSGSQILPIAMPRIFGLFFNAKENPVLGDIKVRQAIASAVNKKGIAAAVPSSGAIAIDSVLPLRSLGFASNTTVHQFDPEKSRQLLESAGWKDTDGDGIREKKVTAKGKTNITPLSFVLTTSDWPDLLNTAALIEKALREVGIEVIVEKKALSDLESTVIRPRKFEIMLFGQVYGYEPDPFAFWHSSQVKDPGLNVALYANKSADRILEDARHLPDPQARAAKYEELQKIITRDIPAVFLYSQVYLYAISDDLRGVDIKKISLPADRFNEAHEWYKDTKRVWK